MPPMPASGCLTQGSVRAHSVVLARLQVSTYLPDWLPAQAVYQPSVPQTEDLAVLMDGDEDADIEVLRSKGARAHVCVCACATAWFCVRLVSVCVWADEKADIKAQQSKGACLCLHCFVCLFA